MFVLANKKNETPVSQRILECSEDFITRFSPSNPRDIDPDAARRLLFRSASASSPLQRKRMQAAHECFSTFLLQK